VDERGPTCLVVPAWYARQCSWWKGVRLGQLLRLSATSGASARSVKRPPASLCGISCRLMVVPALPSPPCFGLGLARGLRDGARQGTTRGEGGSERRPLPSASLAAFAACWPSAVLVFFTWRHQNCPATGCRPRGCRPVGCLAAQDSAAARCPGGRCCGLPGTHPPSPHSHPGWLAWMSSAMSHLITIPEMPTLPAELRQQIGHT